MPVQTFKRVSLQLLWETAFIIHNLIVRKTFQRELINSHKGNRIVPQSFFIMFDRTVLLLSFAQEICKVVVQFSILR